MLSGYPKDESNAIMKKVILVVIGLVFSQWSFLNAQKFGDVSYDQVAKTVHAVDSSAEASYIFKKTKASFEFFTIYGGETSISSPIFSRPELVVTHHHRIKIYNERGERYGEFTIPLYEDGSKKESVENIRAFTYNVKGDKLKRTTINNENIYFEERSQGHLVCKFVLPDVKAGSVIDVKYEFRSPFIFTIPTFYFQEYVPVDYAEYIVEIPRYYVYAPIVYGEMPIIRPSKNSHIYTASVMSAIKKDKYVLNEDDNRSSIKYEIYSVEYPGIETEYFVKDWNEIAKDLMGHKDFGKELKKKSKKFKSLLSSVKSKTKEEKIFDIYSYVQSNYSWNGEYGYYKSVGAKKMIEYKTGNVGDINQLLLNLLVKAGIDAKPFLIKKRSSGLLSDGSPSRTEMNYLLVYIPDGDSYVLLDGTSKYAQIGELPLRATNVNGLLINGEEGKIIDTPNPNIYRSRSTSTYDLDTNTPKLFGEKIVHLKNYAASSYRRSLNRQVEEESFVQEEENKSEIFVENDVELMESNNVDDINENIKQVFKEKIYQDLDKIGEQIFISATMNLGITENPFYEEKRKHPVFFDSLIDVKDIVRIKIPEGYFLESLPEAIAIELDGRKAEFIYSAEMISNTIVVNYTMKVNSDVFSPEEYPKLKELYDRIVDKSKEKIVFGKGDGSASLDDE